MAEAMHDTTRLKRTALLLAKVGAITAWLSLLAAPLVLLRVDAQEQEIIFLWRRLGVVVAVIFALVFLIQWGRGADITRRITTRAGAAAGQLGGWLSMPRVQLFICFGCIAIPWFASAYQISILTTALMYVVLGLGLNIVVGLAGLLDLGYVAFYAVGAYAYALSYEYWGLGFWTALPAAGFLAAFVGIVLGIPVLRLRGDYLAIVTLGFGEIIRLMLENWSEVTKGPAGISGIPKPAIPGLSEQVPDDFASLQVAMYYIILAMTVITIIVVARLRDSRIGRSWLALREDEIATQILGINKTRTKLNAFALGACWAGLVGVFFAAKNSFVNPASFTFIHSAIILCIVVLGGMGSILGVIIAALVLTLLPEYLRTVSEYRMLIFGAMMVLMMVLKPGGFSSSRRAVYYADKRADS